MLILVCEHPLEPGHPDPDFVREVEAAERAGASVALVSYEALVHDGAPERAVRAVAVCDPPVTAVYRGWILRAEVYAALYGALRQRGVVLVNDPAGYACAQELPRNYPFLSAHTARSTWLPAPPLPTLDEVMAALATFAGRPVVLKDYVKSQKHEWAKACFVPDSGDRAGVERVVSAFVELRGDDLQGGLVFREFLDLELLGPHPQSGAPMAREYRTYFLDGRPLFRAEYWSEGVYGGEEPPVDLFSDVARTVPCRFFAMDVARCSERGWVVVELNDGQVAGLPDQADVDAFYRALVGRWPGREASR